MNDGVQQWEKAWQALGQPADPALRDQLVARWGEPHRCYHSLHHLHECLDLFDQVWGLAQRPGEVALALWFHDAFYDPQRSDNEERSAQWAHGSVMRSGLLPEVADRVHALVMATRHQAPPEGADTQLLVDVDLAPLGAPDREFDESSAQIRVEYAHVPEAQYRTGRIGVLQRFLDRPRLYNTAHFYALLETRARNNLKREIASLAG